MQFGETQIFPYDCKSVSADGADIELAENGLYLVQFKTDYELRCYGGSNAVLELDGSELPASEITMAEKNGNSAGLLLMQARAGATLKIKLDAYDKLSSAKFYVVITLFEVDSDES